MRKSKKISKELRDAASKFDKLKALNEEAIKEEIALLNNLSTDISDKCTDANVFCGVILTPKDLANIVELAATKNEVIKIPFKLYFNDNENN